VAGERSSDRGIGRAKLESGTYAEPIYLGSAAGAAQRGAPDRQRAVDASRPYPPLAVTDAPPVALSESERRHAAR